MKQEGDQQAAPGCVEQGSQDHADGNHPKEIRSESPGTLRRATDQECRDMPDGPEGGKPALEQRKGQPAPAELFDGANQERRGHGGQRIRSR